MTLLKMVKLKIYHTIIYLDDGGDEPAMFKCQDFIVVDNDAKITLLKWKLFEEIDKEKKKGEVLMKSITKPIISISVRPNSNTIAIMCDDGNLYEWDFHNKSSKL